jgi:hypothetical protein
MNRDGRAIALDPHVLPVLGDCWYSDAETTYRPAGVTALDQLPIEPGQQPRGGGRDGGA